MTFAVSKLPNLIPVIAVVAIALIGFVVTRRRGRRAPGPPREPISKQPPPPVVERAPSPPPVVETPPAPPPVVETPPAPPTVVETPAAAPPAPTRGRVRSIGASVARLFRGDRFIPEQWEELEEVLL